MKNLISMIDYISEIEENSYTKTEKYNIIERENKCIGFDRIINYKNFLKQPLNIGMFIESKCDKNKEKVLFDGFELNYKVKGVLSVLSKKGLADIFFFNNGRIYIYSKRIKTVEDIIQFDLELKKPLFF